MHLKIITWIVIFILFMSKLSLAQDQPTAPNSIPLPNANPSGPDATNPLAGFLPTGTPTPIGGQTPPSVPPTGLGGFSAPASSSTPVDVPVNGPANLPPSGPANPPVNGPINPPANSATNLIPMSGPSNVPAGVTAIPLPNSPTGLPGSGSQLQTDVAQFQNWLQTNAQTNASSSQAVPPPPPSPPPPNKKIRLVHHKPKKHMVRIQTGPNAPLVVSPPMTYEQEHKIMWESAPPSPAPSKDSVEAFNGMLQQNMPLTPEQVVKLRQLIDTSQRAASIPANVPPKPVSSTLIINLAPGATPPAIRLSQGYVSSLVFVDSTGAPWPIGSYDIGDPRATSIQWDGKSNILLIQAITPYSQGNMVIRLVGLPTPITLELVSGQRVVDYRTDIHVPGIGPNTKDLPIGTPLPNSANQLLLSVLDGVAPSTSKELKVKGGDCQAWLLGETMFLRTRLTVLSPGWIGKMVSPDGMIAYQMPRTSSVLVSQYGNPIELKIEGF